MTAQTPPGRWWTLSERIGFEEPELETWEEVAEGLVDNFDPETSLFEQQSGYFDLEHIDLRDLEPGTKLMDLAGPDSRNHISSSRPT